ncbi:hypothetical protein [Bradyrhizobium sp. Bra64]|uniref:hypothetical protein n=1 Tax=Bradyrhizobium sp. Bra64 TaxID=2926009 RepID=UPI002119ADA1|nr:hypothetical protein [Bradyrhizobium sp. Bra64]
MQKKLLQVVKTQSILRPSFGYLNLAAAAVVIAISTLALPSLAAIDPANGSRYLGHAAVEIEQWQRIDFRSGRAPFRRAGQIKVAISTKGPSLQGLIRIPGALASNFDTGNGMTVVDLTNAGDDNSGYADIVALEIFLTQTMPGQFYEVFAVEDRDQAK